MDVKNFVTCCFLLFSINFCFGQKEYSLINGTIANYANQSMYIYRCYGDTLFLVDSTVTAQNGNFVFSIKKSFIEANYGSDNGMYRINLPHNQWFYVLYDKEPIELQTVYRPDMFYNWAMDSMKVVKSDENKLLYRFQKLQMKKVVADKVLREMMRLFPYFDSYRNEMEKEYLQRYHAYEKLMQEANKKKPQFMATKIINAYYEPNPDWQQPDPWRDSIIAAHYFDYFNPADSFYLHTNILPEKMDIYLQLITNKRDAYGQPVHNEMDEAKAAGTFLDKIGDASTRQDFIPFAEHQVEAYEFCLNYFLKRFDKQHKEQAFLYLYDNYLKTFKGDCGEESNKWIWAHNKAELYKGLQIGMQAPDFVLDVNTGLNLYAIQSPQVLLVFYASWCPHCGEEIPKIKQITDHLLPKELTIIAISLDTSKTEWNNFVNKNQLLSWLHYSEWKSWKSDVVKQYNVYATPTMFLLNEDKKIIANPISAADLLKEMENKK